MLVEVNVSGVKTWRYGRGSDKSIGRCEGAGESEGRSWLGFVRGRAEKGRKDVRENEAGLEATGGGLSAGLVARSALMRVLVLLSDFRRESLQYLVRIYRVFLRLYIL